MAAGKRDIVWVADRIVTELKARLPAQLDALDTEYNDGMVLEDVGTDYYFVAEQRKLPGFPMVCVIPETTSIPANGEDNYGIERHRLTVAVAVSVNEDPDKLKRRTARYIRAFQEVFLDYRTLSGSVTDITCGEKVFLPLMAGGNAILQEGQLNIEVMTNEY